MTFSFRPFIYILLHALILVPSISSSQTKSDEKTLLVAVKYVSIENNAKSTVSKNIALQNLIEVNEIWEVCNIQFFLDRYVSINYRELGLSTRDLIYKNSMEMYRITEILYEPNFLSIIGVGTIFSEDSGLQINGVGIRPHGLTTNIKNGALIAKKAKKNIRTIAHEIGHLFGHDHSRYINGVLFNRIPGFGYEKTDDLNLMVNGEMADRKKSINLTSDQCKASRNAVLSSFSEVLR